MELNNAFDPGAGVQQYSRSDGAGFFYVIYANILDPDESQDAEWTTFDYTLETDFNHFRLIILLFSLEPVVRKEPISVDDFLYVKDELMKGTELAIIGDRLMRPIIAAREVALSIYEPRLNSMRNLREMCLRFEENYIQNGGGTPPVSVLACISVDFCSVSEDGVLLPSFDGLPLKSRSTNPLHGIRMLGNSPAPFELETDSGLSKLRRRRL